MMNELHSSQSRNIDFGAGQVLNMLTIKAQTTTKESLEEIVSYHVDLFEYVYYQYVLNSFVCKRALTIV